MPVQRCMMPSGEPKPENPQQQTNEPVAGATTETEPQRRAGGEGGQGPDRRKSVLDRRVGTDRRQMSRDQAGYSGPERRVAERRESTGLERRRGPGRRRSDDR